MTKRFLLWFANEFHGFRKPEIEALMKLFRIEATWEEPVNEMPYSIIKDCSHDQIKQIMSRTVLIKWAFELWAVADTRQELYDKIKTSPFVQDEGNRTKSFKIQIETYNRCSQKYKLDRINELAFLNFNGKVDLTTPENIFTLIEFFPKIPYPTKGPLPGEEPLRLFFGKQIGEGQRHLIHKHNLRDRKFISNTTMDPTLSLIISNLAAIKNGDLVLDPFVGSGGLLVAAAEFGGYVFGTDIDFKLLYGLSKSTRPHVKEREPDETIYRNLVQYGLQGRYGDIIAGDASRLTLRENVRFDAIICDPPYGIRESSIQVGSKKSKGVPEEYLDDHIPSKIQYNLGNIIMDLLYFACKYLAKGGRICFWVPILKNRNFPDPEHCCFKFISRSDQNLTNYVSRALICMEKTKELSECDEDQISNMCLELGDAWNFKEELYGLIKERIELKKHLRQTKLLSKIEQ